MKYKLTDETKVVSGHILHRIECVEPFVTFNGKEIKAGDRGGWIEKETNLSQDGKCWAAADAQAYGNARVCDNAWVCDNARVYGNAQVYGNARVYGNAQAYGNAWVHGNARVCGNARVTSQRDYIVFKNWWSSGRYFTWTRIDDMWTVGCLRGTGEELIKKAYADSESSGREYERIVRYVEEIKKQLNKSER